MKILALASSPEIGGNSDTLLDSFIEGIKISNRELEIEKIYIDKISIKNYSHDNKYPSKYEREFIELVKKMESSSALIIATPTYNFGLPAGLKNFIDRILYVALDYKRLNIFKQPTGKLGYLKTYFIVSGGTSSFLEKMLFFIFPGFILKITFAYFGAKNKGSFYGGNLTYRTPAKNNKKLLLKIQKQGEEFAKKII